MRRPDLLRNSHHEGGSEVTTTELFFDLVYVFTFIQLSEFQYENLSWAGLLQTAVLFLAVWWAWMETAWATNALDAGRARVTALVSLLMVFGLLMASAIEETFDAHDSRALTFAAAYVALQMVRTGFMVWAFGPVAQDRMGRNYVRLLVWTAVAAVPWLIGGIVDGVHLRLALWLVAIAIELAGPLISYRLPFAGFRSAERWTVQREHLAERCQLVLIIAFGESLLRLGKAFAEERGNPGVVTAFLVGFLLIVALWATYFLRHATHGLGSVGSSDRDAVAIGRSAYTYAHGMMVGGVLAVAVAIHLAIQDPGAHVTLFVGTDFLLGPLLYVVGLTVYRFAVGAADVVAPIVTLPVLLLLGIPAALISRLAELAALAVVAITLSLVTLHYRSEEEDAAAG